MIFPLHLTVPGKGNHLPQTHLFIQKIRRKPRGSVRLAEGQRGWGGMVGLELSLSDLTIELYCSRQMFIHFSRVGNVWEIKLFTYLTCFVCLLLQLGDVSLFPPPPLCHLLHWQVAETALACRCVHPQNGEGFALSVRMLSGSVGGEGLF